MRFHRHVSMSPGRLFTGFVVVLEVDGKGVVGGSIVAVVATSSPRAASWDCNGRRPIRELASFGARPLFCAGCTKVVGVVDGSIGGVDVASRRVRENEGGRGRSVGGPSRYCRCH
jgi:hypothetical protein